MSTVPGETADVWRKQCADSKTLPGPMCAHYGYLALSDMQYYSSLAVAIIVAFLRVCDVNSFSRIINQKIYGSLSIELFT